MEETKTNKVLKETEIISSSLGGDRNIIIIPLFGDDLTLRKSAIEFVDRYLEFSINKLHLENYKDYSKYEEISIFVSEVVKCLIESNYWANFYFNRSHKYIDLERLDTRELKDLNNSSLIYMRKIYDYMWKNREEIIKRIREYNALCTEDDNILEDTKVEVEIPKVQVVCLISEQFGFLGMIYSFLKIYDFKVGYSYAEWSRIKEEFEDEPIEKLLEKNNRKETYKALEVFGIRSTTFAVGNKQRNIAVNLLIGLRLYAFLLKIPVIHVTRTPLGSMGNILLNLGFDHDWYTEVKKVRVSEYIDIINMGCEDKITKDDEWFEVDNKLQTFILS